MMIYIPSWQIGGILSLALLLIVGLGIYLTIHILRKLSMTDRRWLYLMLACFFIPLIFYIAVSLLPKPFFIPRYLAHIVLFFYALIGIITALGFRFGKKKASVVFGGISLVLVILGIFQLHSTGNSNFERMQLPKTADIRQLITCSKSSVIVADDPYTYIDSVYYYNGCDLRFYSRDSVDLSGGYAPLHGSSLRVSASTTFTNQTLYVLHWAGSTRSFSPSSHYALTASMTIEKQVVDTYQRIP
jgi:hypothetical protein